MKFVFVLDGNRIRTGNVLDDSEETPEGFTEGPLEIWEDQWGAYYDGVSWSIVPRDPIPAEPEPKTPEQQQIEALQQQLAIIQTALDELILGGVD